jgi:hypothetical protein
VTALTVISVFLRGSRSTTTPVSGDSSVPALMNRMPRPACAVDPVSSLIQIAAASQKAMSPIVSTVLPMK